MVIYVVGITTEGPLKQLLAGFWYTDPHRTAASVALLAVPLASLGLGSLSDALFNLVFPDRLLSSRGARLGVAILIGVVVSYANVMLPNIGYPQGAFHEAYAELTAENKQTNKKLLTFKETRSSNASPRSPATTSWSTTPSMDRSSDTLCTASTFSINPSCLELRIRKIRSPCMERSISTVRIRVSGGGRAHGSPLCARDGHFELQALPGAHAVVSLCAVSLCPLDHLR